MRFVSIRKCIYCALAIRGQSFRREQTLFDMEATDYVWNEEWLYSGMVFRPSIEREASPFFTNDQFNGSIWNLFPN